MKKYFLLTLGLLLSATIFAQDAIDNSIHDGGEYLLYNVYYGRVLGGNANDTSPALSTYGTNEADDYVFVAEASTLHQGYYWLRHKRTGKYLQASNAEGDTWSVWLAGSLNTAYNSYEWALAEGTSGFIKSNRGEVIHSSSNAYLAPDPNHESEAYVYVYYDKPYVDRAVWQIVSAQAGLEAGRKALYLSELNDLINQGDAIMQNPAYGTNDEKYALAAALYNARTAAENGADIDTIVTAIDALRAAIDNEQEGNYSVWISGKSFTTANEFTVALNGVKFAAAAGDDKPFCTMLVRNTNRTGAVFQISEDAIKAGTKEFAMPSAESYDIHIAFDGNGAVVYVNGQQLGVAEQDIVPTMSACGQSAEWTIFGTKALDAYRPEIISTNSFVTPGNTVYNSHNKAEACAIKLVGQDIAIKDIDYHIAADSAMTASKIDLQGDDAWLIFDNVRPSDVMAYYIENVTINGTAAIPEQLPYYDDELKEEIFPDNSNANCRVAIYLHGAVVIPHSADYKPFFAYTDPAYAGSEYVIPLGDNHELGMLANEMQSFILKRGYMATLANNADGSGYSRVYVADHEDKRISELPDLLDQRVSFIFVRKWNYVSKKGWCGTSSDKSMGESGKLLGATWFYSWSASRESQIDMEFIPMQCHRFWPSLEEFYPKHNSTAMLLLNEPEHNEQHTSDRCSCGGTTNPWTACTMNPDYFHTGLRIGGPSPTDTQWLKEYVGHCNDMAYRVDFVGYHAYWGTYEAADAAAWKSRLKSVYDNTKRPVWLTEWNNGASWTKEPWPSSWNDQLDYQRRKVIEICDMLDNADFIERYTIFNLNEDKRKVLKWDSELDDWWVTPAGEAYRDQHPTHAYNEAMQFIPTGWFPSVNSDIAVTFTFDEAAKTYAATILNPNGDNTAYEAIEYLDDAGDYLPLVQAPRCDLDVKELRAYSGKVEDLPSEALMSDKLVMRLKVMTHKGETATSKRLIVTIPESLRVNNSVESIAADVEARFFNLQGLEVLNPEPGQVYIIVQGEKTYKAVYGK